MPNKEITDLEIIVYVIKKAQQEKHFGDVVLNFREGSIVYFRKNKVETAEDIKKEMLN